MRAHALWVSIMGQREARARTLSVKLERDDRVDALRPHFYAPSLNNSPVWQEVDVTPDYKSTETRERPANFTFDLRWRTRKGAKLS
jgi:hypothetical protein